MLVSNSGSAQYRRQRNTKEMLRLLVLALVCMVDAKVLKFEPDRNHENAVIKMEAPYKKPDFCNGLDCPSFKVIETTKDYELREYAMSNWVTTQLSGIDYSQAQYTMFMRLFNYIQGNNVKKMKIAMTCPVIVRIIPGQGPACEDNFTMSFFVPPSMANPPKPTDPTVELTSMRSMRVYVRGFGGFATLQKYQDEALALGKAINDQSKYVTDHWFTGGYDAPFKLFNRHNEIWFLAK
ncbi:unnamed protein product [Owenia fusiformis]|uniref:Uncharacterized protein n=1 Tax=Owenia fusiformis TaxID=6347 RepID=A0A8J1XU16_OWEFU|nr:unnamed protein product [Owenia fusiformis]